jgi:hypothetical protein
MVRVAFVATFASLVLASCMAASMSVSDCVKLCEGQGSKVKAYRVGSVVPIFKPRPPVICECG